MAVVSVAWAGESLSGSHWGRHKEIDLRETLDERRLRLGCYIIDLELIGPVASMVERDTKREGVFFHQGLPERFPGSRSTWSGAPLLFNTSSNTELYCRLYSLPSTGTYSICYCLQTSGRILRVFPVGDSLIGGFAAIVASTMTALHIRKK